MSPMMKRKNEAPTRSAMDVGTGDYVKIGSTWKKISSNSAEGASHPPRNWTVQTEDGCSYDMYGVNRYARKEDMEP